MLMRIIPAALAALALVGAGPLLAEDPPTATARPPELVKLEAQAATEIPAPVVPAGRAAEAKKVAETAVAVRRAQWVVEKLLPPPPEGLTLLKFDELKAGTRGWVDLTADVVKVQDGVAIVRPPTAREGVEFAVPVTSEARTVNLRGEYVADRRVTIDGKEVLVLREVTAAKDLEPGQAALLDAARKRLEEAKSAHAQAVAVLRDVRAKAEQAITQRAREQAEKQVVIPKDADVEEQVRIRARQQELALKLAKGELDKLNEQYGAPIPADAAAGARATDPGIRPPGKAPKPVGTVDPIKDR
jgi:hypothetical protein